MKHATTALLVATALLALALGPSAAKKRKSAPCPAGRFLLPADAPLIAGDAAPGLDAVVLDDARMVSIASGCPSVRGKVTARRKGTRVGARWKRGACRDLRGKARLTARFDATCTTLTGKLKAKKFTRRFTARRSACGDGVLDATVGERCPGLEAAPGLAAIDAIADVDLDTGVTDGEVSELPNGVRLARTRLEIELADGVTVAQVNALLAGVGAEILLTLAGQPFLLVRIPDPETVEALDAVVAALAADPAVVAVSKGYFAGLAEVPANYDAGNELSMRSLDNHVPVRALAAWNARAALAPAAERPTLIIQDTFGDGVPANDFALSGLVAEDFAAGAPVQHGYHVLGIATATFGSARPCRSVFSERDCVTGMMPDTVAARAVDLREGALVTLAEGGEAEKVRTLRDTANARMLKLMRDTTGPLVVNTSLHDCATGICGDPVRAAQEARKWSRRVRLLYRLADRLLHVTASGNVGERGSPDGADASTASGWAAAGLLPGLGADSLADSVLVVDNAFGFGTVPTRAECLHPTSKWGGDVAAMGTAVVSLAGATRGATILTGTSMATPQVAGLALYLWSLDPTMTVGNVRDAIARTATPLAASAAPACSVHPAAPVIDAYGAVLALDGAAPPTPAGAPVRNAILDVAGGDRRFDGADLAQYLKAYVQNFVGAANHGPPVEPAARDWSRYDLNGDGFTGGPGTAAFDVDRVGSTQYGAPSLTTVAKSIAGSQVPFDETALTDMQILCYYAYSDLYQGTPAERTALLDPALCGVSDAAFDYTQINGGFFQFCVARLHVTITEPDGTMTNQVDENICHGDQIPNFNEMLLPKAEDVPGNLCLGARAPASVAHFDVATQSVVGRRTERTAASDTLFDSEWLAPIDTGANRVDQIAIDSCRSLGVFPIDRRHFVLRNLTGAISPGLFAVELTGQAACDALTSGEFSIEVYQGVLSDPKTIAFTSPECDADSAKNYLILRFLAD